MVGQFLPSYHQMLMYLLYVWSTLISCHTLCLIISLVIIIPSSLCRLNETYYIDNVHMHINFFSLVEYCILNYCINYSIVQYIIIAIIFGHIRQCECTVQ